MKIKVACNIVENFLLTNHADLYTMDAFTAMSGYVKGLETKREKKAASSAARSVPADSPSPLYGKPWDKTEENALSAEFYSGMSAKMMAQNHGRTIEAIAARLVKLGCITRRDDLPGYAEYRSMVASHARA